MHIYYEDPLGHVGFLHFFTPLKFEYEMYVRVLCCRGTGGASRFQACYDNARPVVAPIHKPAEVKTKNFVLISYYIEKAQEAGLVGTSIK